VSDRARERSGETAYVTKSPSSRAEEGGGATALATEPSAVVADVETEREKKGE
jgi:hypothetical protein